MVVTGKKGEEIKPVTQKVEEKEIKLVASAASHKSPQKVSADMDVEKPLSKSARKRKNRQMRKNDEKESGSKTPKGNDEKQTVSKTQETVVTEEKVEEVKAV